VITNWLIKPKAELSTWTPPTGQRLIGTYTVTYKCDLYQSTNPVLMFDAIFTIEFVYQNWFDERG
jgi:hypothetical protein